MAMNEIIVIEDDSDLEEGEITDDVFPDIKVFQSEKKQLPHRYTLHNKGRHKNLKHKEKDKFQSPSKLKSFHKKKHKSSCRRISEKYRLKNKEDYFNHNSVNISAFKNYTSPPRVPPLPKRVSSNLPEPEYVDNYPKLLSDYKRVRERLNKKIESVQNDNPINSLKNEAVSLINDSEKANITLVKQELTASLPQENFTELKNAGESDEDVEELRRIALATYAKNQVIKKVDEGNSNEMPKLSSSDIPSSYQVLSNHLIETSCSKCDNDSQDNYEVVDMDLDEEDSCKIVHDHLYIIDKTPATTELFPNINKEKLNQSLQITNAPVKNYNHFQLDDSQPVDELEEQLLRAEVIASMSLILPKRESSPKYFSPAEDEVSEIESMSLIPPKLESSPKYFSPVEDEVSEIVAKIDILQNAETTLSKEMRPKPCTIYSKGPLQNFVKAHPKKTVAKSKFSSFKNKTVASPPLPRGVSTMQERLIITLNNDSSTDESEEDSNKNTSNVPMSSIEALISSARQKSDAAQLSNECSNVSCLSKAQQEEYNSLKKLLAEKTQYSVQAPVVKEKKPANQTFINLLPKKLSEAKASLEKEVGIRTQIEKNLLEKKRNYMASKLKVQMLKEKLHAAEKIRAANLENWKQCSAKLDIVKKSVSKRESLLKLLETELNTRNLCSESNATTAPV